MSVRTAARRVVAGLLAATVTATLAACTGEEEVSDELQVVKDPTAAMPAESPEPTVEPAGVVLAADGAGAGEVTALTTDSDTGVLAVAVAEPARVLLYDLAALDDPAAQPTATVKLPGPAENLTVSETTLLAPVPSANTLARVSLPDGKLDETPLRGGPTDAAALNDQILVSLRERKGVGVVGNDRVSTIEGGLNSADDVVVTGGQPVVLDRLRSAVFLVDVDGADIGAGLRAGQGAANIAADDFGRVFVTDIRRGALLAFSLDPLLLRQRYPVPGGAYDLAYDLDKDLLWVTLTSTNEVVGFDVRGGEPSEKHRFPTVRQPNSVTVEEGTSRVVVGSAVGEGIQVITP